MDSFGLFFPCDLRMGCESFHSAKKEHMIHLWCREYMVPLVRKKPAVNMIVVPNATYGMPQNLGESRFNSSHFRISSLSTLNKKWQPNVHLFGG